ncbi:complement C1q-like protein 4 [Saccostrea cucullata]|uniref:complement C1q-like protein 4 n=1 Tax=Saccostrea cuccullata TaxID=36930 RepID=UPI002ED576E1
MKKSASDQNEIEPSSISNGKRLVNVGTTGNNPVAFYAYMSKSEQNPSNHHMIIFDVIKSNFGGGYNGHSGTFTAPVAGIYVFTWTIYTGDHGRCEYGIYVNDDILSSTFGETDDVGADYDSDSGTIVVALNAHDDVYIRSLMACTTFIESIRWYTRTSFAGWKLD